MFLLFILESILKYFFSKIGEYSVSISFILLMVLVKYFILKKEKLFNKKLLKINNIKISKYIVIDIGIKISYIFIVSLLKSSNSNAEEFSIYLVLVLAPILEELFFRKLMIDKISKEYSVKISIVISALLFSIIHINPLSIIYSFFIGVYFGIVYVETKSVGVTMILHFLHNFSIFLLTKLSNEVIGIILYFSLPIFFLIILAYFNKNYKKIIKKEVVL